MAKERRYYGPAGDSVLDEYEMELRRIDEIERVITFEAYPWLVEASNRTPLRQRMEQSTSRRLSYTLADRKREAGVDAEGRRERLINAMYRKIHEIRLGDPGKFQHLRSTGDHALDVAPQSMGVRGNVAQLAASLRELQGTVIHYWYCRPEPKNVLNSETTMLHIEPMRLA